MAETLVIGGYRYRQMSADEIKAIPAGVRFDVLRRDQGQIVERSWGDWPVTRAENGPGDKYHCVVDRSLPSSDPEREVYYVRIPKN